MRLRLGWRARSRTGGPSRPRLRCRRRRARSTLTLARGRRDLRTGTGWRGRARLIITILIVRCYDSWGRGCRVSAARICSRACRTPRSPLAGQERPDDGGALLGSPVCVAGKGRVDSLDESRAARFGDRAGRPARQELLQPANHGSILVAPFALQLQYLCQTLECRGHDVSFCPPSFCLLDSSLGVESGQSQGR